MGDLETIRARAEAGEGAAQYQLATVLDARGDKAGAAAWLERSAAMGHPGALYTKAAQMLAGPPEAMAPKDIARLLERAVEAGGHAAARQLAVLKALGFGTGEDWDGAVALLKRAAAAGRPDALRELAALALALGGEENGVKAALRAAAARGDPIAREIAGPTAAESEISLDALARAALTPRARAAERIVLREEAPRIEHVKSALTAFECAYLIAAARPLMQPSAVVDSARARRAGYRTSDGGIFSLPALDLVVIALWRRLAAIAGHPPERSELIDALRYRPGQEYRPHHDYLPEDSEDYSGVRRYGQRAASLLVPLNGAFEGGETVFPRLEIRFRGAAGDALCFENIDASGAPLPLSLHAGAPVVAGEKWLVTLWFRQKTFWFWKE